MAARRNSVRFVSVNQLRTPRVLLLERRQAESDVRRLLCGERAIVAQLSKQGSMQERHLTSLAPAHWS
jgi:hypothetical protein